jgi:hypothetical protein
VGAFNAIDEATTSHILELFIAELDRGVLGGLRLDELRDLLYGGLAVVRLQEVFELVCLHRLGKSLLQPVAGDDLAVQLLHRLHTIDLLKQHHRKHGQPSASAAANSQSVIQYDSTPRERACKLWGGARSVDELLRIAREEGYELTDDELDAVNGGDWDCWEACSKYEKPTTCNAKDCSTLGIL